MYMLAGLRHQYRDLIGDMFETIYAPNPNKHTMVFSSAKQEDQYLLMRAFNYARQAHALQYRKGSLKRPYTDHILMVWYMTNLLGGNIQQQVAAILHDVIEDCQAHLQMSALEIKSAISDDFSDDIATLVWSLTTDIGKISHENELCIINQLNDKAKLIKSADNFSNMWDLIHDTPSYTPEGLSYAKNFRVKVFKTCNPQINWFSDAFWWTASMSEN